MNKKSVTLILAFTVFFGMVSAANNTTVENTWNFTANDIDRTFSVGTTSSLDLGLTASGNESETVKISVNGNISDFVYSIQSPVQTIPNSTVSVLNQIVVDRNDHFGTYNGTIVGKGGNESEKVNVSFKVVDDINPSITSTSFSDVMATEPVTFTVSVKDNLNVSKVSMNVFREVEKEEGNETVLVNKSVDGNFVFNQENVGKYSYKFEKTGVIGQYYANVTVRDSANNTVSQLEGFEVNGLDSIHVKRENFVFDTIRPKEQTGEKFVVSDLEGKKFTVGLKSLSYGGNESVKVGVVPPGGDSPEILKENESQSYSKKGVYEVVLLHTGSNEVKGTHSVTGELSVSKPEHHVEPVNVSVSFSGTVKNLDKPPETCTRVAEFQTCIAYSFDSAKKMFEENYGKLENPNKSRVFMISSLPTSQVEGSNEWRDSTSLTMGEYNETINRFKNKAENAVQRADGLETQRNISVILLLIGVGLIYQMRRTEGTFVISHKIPKDKVVKRGD